MMKSVNPPFLELHFYKSDKNDVAMMKEVIACLFDNGATLSGRASAFTDFDFSSGFAGVTDHEQETVPFHRMEDYDALSSNHQLVSLDMLNASGLRINKSEIVTFTSIPDAIKGISNHPVAIFTESEDSEGNFILMDKKSRRSIYNRFIDLCIGLDITYGAICCELGMETPEELKLLKYKSIAFKDFFVNVKYYSEETINSILTLSREYNAFIETFDTGYFISANNWLNGKVFESTTQDISDIFSMLVCKLISNIEHYKRGEEPPLLSGNSNAAQQRYLRLKSEK